MKFYTSIEEGSKLKGRKFWGLIPTFAEVTEENLVGGRGMGRGGGGCCSISYRKLAQEVGINIPNVELTEHTPQPMSYLAEQ